MKRPIHLNNGMDRRDVIRLAKDLGCTVDFNGAGDLRFTPPSPSRLPPITFSSRRKDVPRCVPAWLRRLIKEKENA